MTSLKAMFNNWVHSLSARLWITSIAALTVGLAVLAAFVIYVFGHFPEQTLGKRKETEATSDIVSGIRFDSTGRPADVRVRPERAWLFEALPTELGYRVLDQRGNVLFESGRALGGTPWIAGDLPDSAGQVRRIQLGAKQFDIVTLKVSHGSATYYVQTATSVRFIEALVGEKVRAIPSIVRTTLFLAAIIFFLTLTFTAHRVLRPLREASRAAARITPRNLTTRLSTARIPSDIKPLIDAFNDALDRLEKGFAVQQQFLASAAHELQTPLTLIRGQIELQPEMEGKDLLFREIDLMSRQVRQLLHLAEVSEAQNFSFADVEVVDVAQDVIAYLARKADAKRVKLYLDASASASTVWADRSALFILLKNILENAINASPPNGTILLIVDASSALIEDEGGGIRQEHLPFLFKRFWRAPGVKHEGAGLGLAICKEIASAHAWHLTVSRVVSGTRFVVSFS
jgi:signal transduction histidine kinase